MPIRHSIWKVAPDPEPLHESLLVGEALLETMIVARPGMVSDEWMLIGRQEQTGFSGRIDLLAIAPDGSLVLIELKRDRTPREVVAQAIDYASFVERLKPEEIASIYSRFAPGHDLADDFRVQFHQDLDEDSLNQSHQIVIVAASLDHSTERIIGYLNERGVPINVLFFQVFSYGTEQFLSRSWLLDPVLQQASTVGTAASPHEPWNGEFYASFGHDVSRSWDDARQYGFISAGGAPWYSKTLQLLQPQDRIWVNVPRYGYVGVGRVTGPAQPAREFRVSTASGDVSVLDLPLRANYHREFADDFDKCEYFVPISWLQTVRLDKAVQSVGLFGNQNSVCKPTTPKWRTTVDRLKDEFPHYDSGTAMPIPEMEVSDPAPLA
jgi:hypothetical protein